MPISVHVPGGSVRTFISLLILRIRVLYQKFGPLPFVGVLILMVGFNNCSQPYAIQVEAYKDQPSELAEAVQLTPDLVIGDVQYVTKAQINLSLKKKFAREMVISTTSECLGDWEPFAEDKVYTWTGPDGPSTIYVKFRNFSKEESQCFAINFSYDTLAPALELKKKPGVISPYVNPEFDLDIIEDGSAIKTIEYSINGGPWQATTKTFTTSTLNNGNYRIDIRAEDAVGHESEVLTYQWKVDKNAPLLVFTQEPDFYTNETSATFAFLATENQQTGLTADEFKCKLNNQPEVDCDSPVQFTGLSNGTQMLQIRAFDSANNVAVFSKTWNVDTVLPTIAFVEKPLALSKLKTASFKYLGADTGGTGIEGYECRLDGAAFADCLATGKSYSNLAEGDHTFDVRTYDRAGNVSAPISFAWSIDSIGPVITISSAPNLYTKDQTVTFNYTVTVSGEADLNTIQCRKLATENYTNCSATTKSYTGLPAGAYQFSIQATDMAGNITTVNRNFNIDRTMPVITFSAQPLPKDNRATVTFNYSATDTSPLDRADCSLDNAAFTQCGLTAKTYTGVADGAHVFKLQITDKAGNVRTATINWAIDRTVPTLTLSEAPKNPLEVNKNQYYKYTTTDIQTVKMTCFVNNEQVTANCYSKSFIMYRVAAGTYNIRLVATDPYGNSRTYYHKFTAR